jgi:hypothetical protein
MSTHTATPPPQKVYVIQLWDTRFGWVMVNSNGRPMVYFRKKDAQPDIQKMRANCAGRMRYSANRFVLSVRAALAEKPLPDKDGSK